MIARRLDPSSIAVVVAERRRSWNGVDFSVTIGGRLGTWRHWEDMRCYGFVSAGHGERYRKAMSNLFVGARVWAGIPGSGYVGVGLVTAPAVGVRDFDVEIAGSPTPILTAPLQATDMGDQADDPMLSEYLARVRWIDARRQEQAFWETGMFLGRNAVSKLREPFTLQRLREVFRTDAIGSG